ncbi:MAG: DNA-processing protein DprA [bacterium]
MTEREALIAFNRVQGIGSVTAQQIIEALGSLAAVFEASEETLQAIPGIGVERAMLLTQDLRRVSAEEELERASKTGVHLITWDEETYPALLKEITDPPLVLYVAGDVTALDTPSIAIVGTRHPTVYGRETARRFAYQLGVAGYTIVSGLAEGIDTEAHLGTLKAKGKTVAVLGGALDCLYPKSNTKLAREIVTSGGAVISEYAFGRQPDRQTFPMRNRIVSGLSRGVLVVEAPINSGTLITAGQGMDQNRSVMVIPGRIDSAASQGGHKLLKEGARLVTSPEEVIDEVQDLFVGRSARISTEIRKPVKKMESGEEKKPMPVLTAEERSLMVIVDDGGTPIDVVIRKTGLPAGRVNALLVSLQIKRLMKLMPGGIVMRAS